MGWSPRCYIPSYVKIGPPVLEKKIFEGFLPYMGVAAILVMWPKFGFDWPSGFGEEDVWNCERRTDGRRTPDHGYPISSPMSLWLRWAKNQAFSAPYLLWEVWWLSGRLPEREVRGKKPTTAMLCSWARHLTPRKYMFKLPRESLLKWLKHCWLGH